ncbi:toxin-antitoxin system HicB family antitoxin [Catellatospora sp. NPDC049609]|uniref:toxin-antitoxin system HicB family antitoxin n=1 Tax=Catellatospora sp. NPDC049609 TaxID=3155505 RepID=UPI003413775D
MDLSPYLESLRRDLAAAAAPAGDDIARTAELLTLALDASARLCLIEVLADASAEITTKLDGPTVEVRIRGREADLVVTRAVPAAYETVPEPAPAPPLTEGGDQARLTLRLPEQLKEAVEKAASAEGVSVNSWLVRATANALRPVAPPPTHHLGRRVTGYAQA